MSDNGFSNFKRPDPSPFRLFCEATFLEVFGNPNASASRGSGHTSQSATEPAASGASELCKHNWLPPVNDEVECSLCSKVRWARFDELTR